MPKVILAASNSRYETIYLKWCLFVGVTSGEYSIPLSGTKSNELFEFMRVRVVKCSTSELNWEFIDCADDAARSDYLTTEKHFEVTVFHSNISIHPNSRTNYVKQHVNE